MMRHQHTVSLNGEWCFRTDPELLGELYPEDLVRTERDECQFYRPEYDDRRWQTMPVPSLWQQHGFADYNGAAWYRHRFTLPGDLAGKTVRLRFSGVDYYADIWLNGFYLGSHEGYFAPFEYDVTRYLRAAENVLAVRVDSPDDIRVKHIGEHEHKTLIKGALQDWDVNNLDLNPGGIWNDVTLVVTGPQYVESVVVDPDLSDYASTGSARLTVRAVVRNTAPVPLEATLQVRLAPATFDGAAPTEALAVRLLPGANPLTLTLDVPEARLWWTWDLGRPDLYDLHVTVTVDADRGDGVTLRTGLRSIERRGRGWETRLNGRRLFFRGANYLSDQLLANMTREKYDRDIALLVGANMNMVRPFCVVEKEEFYDACAEQGILVYQDFPMQWRMSTSSDLVRRAVPQAREMIAFLYNQPAIVIWCYGSEPGERNFKKLGMALAAASRAADPTRITHQANETLGHTWDIMREWTDAYDWPIDLHFYLGWYPPTDRPSSRQLGIVENSPFELNKLPRQLFEFVTEYGAQSVPAREQLAAFVPDLEVWPPDWTLLKHHCMQPAYQLLVTPEPQGWDDLIARSQAYQAFLLKYHTEFYRRLKYRPCNGALMFTFNDCWPAITWSVVDYGRRTKAGYDTLRQAFSPLHVLLDWDQPLAAKPSASWAKDVLIVNDLHEDFPDLAVDYRISDATGHTVVSGSFGHHARPNSPAEVAGIIQFVVPADVHGTCRIELSLTDAEGQIRSHNSYELLIATADGQVAVPADP